MTDRSDRTSRAKPRATRHTPKQLVKLFEGAVKIAYEHSKPADNPLETFLDTHPSDAAYKAKLIFDKAIAEDKLRACLDENEDFLLHEVCEGDYERFTALKLAVYRLIRLLEPLPPPPTVSTDKTLPELTASDKQQLREGLRAQHERKTALRAPAAKLKALFSLPQPFVETAKPTTIEIAVRPKHELVLDVTEIEQQPNSEQRETITQLLTQACDVAGYPAEQREALLPKLTDALLRHEAQNETWADKVKHSTEPPRTPLPETAPALWKTDKPRGDTPPEFIKRHYGPWLRSDGLGLAKADLRRLDKSLYDALAQWCRYNSLPADCPLPTLKARNDRAVAEPLESADPKDWARLAIAKRRRLEQAK